MPAGAFFVVAGAENWFYARERMLLVLRIAL
jgi:hypothetical protein